jgi:hypothetical protein
MNHIEFSRNLIKGRIAEVIFEEMFRESGQYTILRFGYEYLTPELAQYQHLLKEKGILDSIRHSPDFILISNDKTKVYMVEVKYRTSLDLQELELISQQTLDRWPPSPWLFIASPQGFYFSPCSSVANRKEIGLLSNNWVAKEIQEKYLGLFNEFAE